MLYQQTSDGIGEICIWGRHVFMGYLERQDETMEVIDEEGWLHTGDLGRMDSQGFLYITGRIKGTGNGSAGVSRKQGRPEHLGAWRSSTTQARSSHLPPGHRRDIRVALLCTPRLGPCALHLALGSMGLGKVPTPALKLVSCPAA